jgi:VCBS repeat-containing protein
MKQSIKRSMFGILLFLICFFITNTIISFCAVNGPAVLGDILTAPWGTCWFASFLIGIVIFLLILRKSEITPRDLFLSLGVLVILTLLFFLWEFSGWDPDINSVWWRYDTEFQNLLFRLHLIPQTDDAGLLSAYAWAYSWNYHLSSHTILHIGFAYLGYALSRLFRYLRLRRQPSDTPLPPVTRKRLIIASSVLGACLVIGITSYVIIVINRPVSTEVSSSDTVYEGGGAILSPGSTSWGYYDVSGTLLDSSATVTPENDQFQTTLSFQQNNDGTVHYGLLVLKNDRQTNYKVDDTDTRFYRFELTGDEEIRIPITVDVSDGTYCVTVAVVTEPDVTSDVLPGGSTNDMMVQSLLENIYIDRFYIDGATAPSPKTVSLTPAKGEKTYGIEVVTDDDHMKEISVVDSGSTMRALYANQNSEACAVTLIAFCDWEQVPLCEDADTITFPFDKGHPGYYDIQLPKNKAGSCYQVIALEEPSRFTLGTSPSYRIFLE